MGHNQVGRQEIFVLGSDNNIWQIWQAAPNNGWSEWRTLGQPVAAIRSSDRITVGRNQDGRARGELLGIREESIRVKDFIEKKYWPTIEPTLSRHEHRRVRGILNRQILPHFGDSVLGKHRALAIRATKMCIAGHSEEGKHVAKAFTLPCGTLGIFARYTGEKH